MQLKAYQFEKQQAALNAIAASFYQYLLEREDASRLKKTRVEDYMDKSDNMQSALDDTFDMDDELVAHQDSLGGCDSDPGNDFFVDYIELATKRVAKRIAQLAKFDVLKAKLGK